MADRSRRQVKKNQDLQHILFKERERSQMRQVRRILKKTCLERTEEELKMLDSVPELVSHIQNSIQKHQCLKERAKEVIDSPEVLSIKCAELAKAMKESSCTVVYTGAGISTSAEIPDYRGPEGVWTLLQKGKAVVFKDLSLAEPTFTHMALKQMHKEGLISHVVSQNCDGLHLRSGLPKSALSEVHGNMFIEVCTKCKPIKQYVRLFDVTERTGLHRHKTGRFCKKCATELKDTIVHFGEKSILPWPMNWKGAVKAVSKADLILCLGTSLKVLRKYHCLWVTDRPPGKRPKLFIVNLQYTPKDSQATLKIHGKCDEVMKHLTSQLGIHVPPYDKENDAIFQLSTPLTPNELSTTTRLFLTKEEPISEQDSKDVSMHIDCKSEIKDAPFQKHVDNPLSFSLDSCSLQPQVKLLDVTSASSLLKINAEKIDSRTYFLKNKNGKSTVQNSSISGWYGKGCAKWMKRKRKSNISLKKMKMDQDS
ncbi:NAD-dependent protein deacetylase sirtuin-7-like [Uloborus diversus]|uniref:NAD-dependent protein deacetylase sirtuin-7-like n=1 Tax=Uloborus diversus TaxID=327109 RepID=UPI0024091849|nr:NAD-dependent protein deacetylase sirtuin-7-like [Uloborus diversus]